MSQGFAASFAPPHRGVVALALAVLLAGSRDAVCQPASGPSDASEPAIGSIEPAAEATPGLGHSALRATRRTRGLTNRAAALLTTAEGSSSIVSDLLARIDRSDVIVYLTDSMPWTSRGPSSYMTFVSHDAAARYLLIRIDLSRLTHTDRIAGLGHELQHALEVASAPEVRDADSMMTLYRRIGWESGAGKFESKAAREIGRRVRSEVVRRKL